MNNKDLADIIRSAVDDGRITTYKIEEEQRHVSRSTIKREIENGQFKAILLKNQWILVKQ